MRNYSQSKREVKGICSSLLAIGVESKGPILDVLGVLAIISNSFDLGGKRMMKM